MVVLNAANVGAVDGGTPFDGIYLYRMHEWLQPTKRLLPRSSDDDEDDLEAAALASMCDHCLKELPEVRGNDFFSLPMCCIIALSTHLTPS